MKIAIADDLETDRNVIKDMVLDFFGRLQIKADITTYESAEALLNDFKPHSFDLILLDIYMGTLNGIDAASVIYKEDKDCRIIFITTANCFAAESYEVKAAYYMIKPITREKLNEVLSIYLKEKIDAEKKLPVISNRASVNVSYSNILYVDVIKRNVKIHLAERLVDADRGFYNVVNPLLDDRRFIECYKGVVVNMEHIRNQIDDDFILDNGEKVPISKRKKKDIIRLFMEYTFEKL